MGFNISGVVINKSLENNNEELSKILGLNIYFEREIDFETASENWKEEGIIDVYFGEKGTLVFANHDLCLEGYSYPQANILTFALSETSMTFSFGYSENNNIIRSKMDVNGEIIDENGEKLQVENENDDISEVIWKQIETVLGKPFWNIEPEEKAYRFLIKNDSSTNQPVNNEQDELTENEKRLKNTEAYKTINEISDEYLKEIESRGKFDLKEVLNGIVNLGEDSRSQELAIKNAQDLIDIYFWKKQLSNPNFKDCVISDSIQVFSFYFKNDALNYLEKFAYVNCPEQQYALNLLLLQAKLNRRKEETFKKIKQNFTSFNDKTKSFVIQYFSTTFPDEKIDFNNPKKWWQFWK